jgi:hypothetical protein
MFADRAHLASIAGRPPNFWIVRGAAVPSWTRETAAPFSSSTGDGGQAVGVALFSDEKRDNDVVSLELLLCTMDTNLLLCICSLHSQQEAGWFLMGSKGQHGCAAILRWIMDGHRCIS